MDFVFTDVEVVWKFCVFLKKIAGSFAVKSHYVSMADITGGA